MNKNLNKDKVSSHHNAGGNRISEIFLSMVLKTNLINIIFLICETLQHWGFNLLLSYLPWIIINRAHLILTYTARGGIAILFSTLPYGNSRQDFSMLITGRLTHICEKWCGHIIVWASQRKMIFYPQFMVECKFYKIIHSECRVSEILSGVLAHSSM